MERSTITYEEPKVISLYDAAKLVVETKSFVQIRQREDKSFDLVTQFPDHLETEAEETNEWYWLYRLEQCKDGDPYKKRRGYTILDMTTANAIKVVCEAMKPEQREKMATFRLMTQVNFVWKCVR